MAQSRRGELSRCRLDNLGETASDARWDSSAATDDIKSCLTLECIPGSSKMSCLVQRGRLTQRVLEAQTPSTALDSGFAEYSSLKVESHIDEGDHHRNLDQRPDHCSESRARVDASTETATAISSCRSIWDGNWG